MVEIKVYNEKYLEDCRKILIETAPPSQVKTERGRTVNRLMYCDFYLQFSPETCFVITNENDNAVGYILCHTNFKEFEADFREHYLKKLYKTSFFAGLTRSFLFKMERRYCKVYPAHLHIDILESHQRMGLGHKLMDTLLQKLKEINISGVYLIVGNSNKKGVPFYKKYGFKKHATLFGGATVFGINTNK
jgi:ribosomal protein S18 acetylase RimI-like enzyme